MAIYRLSPMNDQIVPLVFIHGGPGANSGLFLGSLMRHGSSNLKSKTVIHDQPGCGFDESVVEECNFDTLTQHLKNDLYQYRVVDLVAESFGCTLAVKFAERFPEMVRSVVLIGPHFNRYKAQKKIFSLCASRALEILKDLDTSRRAGPRIDKFMKSREEKMIYKGSSLRTWSIGKDLTLETWSEKKRQVFEAELLNCLASKNITENLRSDLIEIFSADIRFFLNSEDIYSSTEDLKKISKRYDLFFKTENTFDEVRQCREQALQMVDSPYVVKTFDRSNKRLRMDLEKSTNWESENCWELLKKLSDKDLKVNVIYGQEDPFETLGDFDEKLNKNNCRVFSLDQVGHSPLYEKPQETYKILESEYE